MVNVSGRIEGGGDGGRELVDEYSVKSSIIRGDGERTMLRLVQIFINRRGRSSPPVTAGTLQYLAKVSVMCLTCIKGS